MPTELQQLAKINLGKAGENFLDKAPWLANSLLKNVLGFVSPFHRRLGIRLVRWEKRYVEGTLSVRRSLKDHNGNLHAGAISLAGESIALFVLVRNIHLMKYKFELKELNVIYDEPARRKVLMKCKLEPEAFVKLRNDLKQNGETLVTLKVAMEEESRHIATIRSVWRISQRKIRIG